MADIGQDATPGTSLGLPASLHATTQVRSCTASLMFFAACSPLFLCRSSSFRCVLSVLSSRELLCRLFACSRSATTHPPPFSASCLSWFPVSFCAACSFVPVLRPHTRSIRASLPLADSSSRDVPLFSPRLARVSVFVSALRARDRVVSLLAYSVIHAL